MATDRRLLMGMVALVPGRVRGDIEAATQARDEVEALLGSDYFEGAPFRRVGVIIRYGNETNLAPEYQRIRKSNSALLIPGEALPMLIIREELLLNALLKALCKAKFDGDPDEFAEVAQSPFVAEILDRAYDAHITALREAGNVGEAHRRTQTRSVRSTDPEVVAAKSQIRLISNQWMGWTREEKRKHLGVLLAPYRTSEGLSEVIIDQADEELSR